MIAGFESRLAALEQVQTQLSLHRPPAAPPPDESAPANRTAVSAPIRLSAARLITGSEHPVRAFDSASEFRDAIWTGLQALGLKKSAAQIFATEIAAASLAGQTVFFKGGFAADTARACARAAAGPNSFRIIAACCARATTGHAAAAPPSSQMNSRRFNRSNCIRCP